MAVRGMSFGVRADVKKLFFDRKRVVDAVSRAERQKLSKAGAFVRRSARSSIRKRKKISAPGKPPTSHTGLLKRNIFFAYEPNRSSVVIGPVKLNKPSGAPQLLEMGGTVRIRVAGRNKRKRARQLARYKPRPYMGPALRKESPNFPNLFKDSVR
jgi:hypothetical protein